MKLNLLCAYLLLFSAISVHAGSDQVPISRTVTSVQTYETFAFVNFTPAFATTQGCAILDGNTRLVIDLADGKGKEMYSAALAAGMAGKIVGFGVSGCAHSRPKIYRIDTKF